MIAFLQSPRFFDVLILILFACAALRWIAAGDLGRSLYWAAAFLLNVSVVFLMDGTK